MNNIFIGGIFYSITHFESFPNSLTKKYTYVFYPSIWLSSYFKDILAISEGI